MRIGDCPNLLFTPAVDPISGRPLSGKTLIICDPYLYIYIRDLVIADEAAKEDQDTEVAMSKMVQELMKYKPRSQRTEGERKLGPLSIRLEEHYPGFKEESKEEEPEPEVEEQPDANE